MKTCSHCKIEKDFTEFYKNKSCKDGLGCFCKICHNESLKKTIQKNPRQRLNNQKKYREKNREKLRIDASKYVKRNYDQRIIYYKEYARKNEEKVKAHAKIASKIQHGSLIKPTNCEICNSNRKIEAHHEDYSKPFDVKWVCKYCHENIHHAMGD